MCAGLIYLVLFGLSLWRPSRIGVEYLAEGGATEGATQKIWVDVSGAVINGGVYELTSGSRVKDALMAAGGLSDQADRGFVDEVLNLAKTVGDGEKIFIPGKDEVGATVKGVGSSAVTRGKVNINKASESELLGLTGIGQARAGQIIANRPFAAIDDLVTRKIISSGVFEKIKGEIAVY